MKNALIFCLLAVAIATAQNKQRVAVLPSVGDLDPQGLILLTDKVREIATKNLPIDDFNILKQDVITRMIGEEELYRSCKEGVCIGDSAKKTNANYGARCDVIKFENNLVLKFELYSVNEESIFETFTDYDVKDFRGMLASLETRLPDAFKKMISSQKKANNAQIAPKTYTVATAANPSNGGAVSASPKKAAYIAGERVTLTAKPYKGYTFANWSGAAASENGSVTITVDNNVTLTANFQAKPEPEPRPKISAGGGAQLANGIGGGLTWDNSKKNQSMPYTAGGAFLFIDIVYFEAFIGFLAGGGNWQGDVDSSMYKYSHGLPDMRRACVNIGAFAKYPIAAGTVTVFPLLGLEYEASVYGKLVYAGEIPGDYMRLDRGVLSALWFRFGGGADFDLSQSLYLRAEFLYGLRSVNAFEKSRAYGKESGMWESSPGGWEEVDKNTRAGHGFTLKAGAGARF